MPKPDFTYREDGEFVSLFPESQEAESEWNRELAPKTQGTGKVLLALWPEVLAQLRQKGWRVQKARPQSQSPRQDQELLAALA